MRLAVFGATSAIAGETAKRFAADRAEIVLVARDAARLDAVAADLRARGAPRVETLTADLAVIEEHPGLVDKAWTLVGGLDAVDDAHEGEDVPALRSVGGRRRPVRRCDILHRADPIRHRGRRAVADHR